MGSVAHVVFPVTEIISYSYFPPVAVIVLPVLYDTPSIHYDFGDR